MKRACFPTKSMSLNVSGKHNNKCKSTKFFSLSHASHVGSNEHFRGKKKKKVQRKVHLVKSMVVFSRLPGCESAFSFSNLFSFDAAAMVYTHPCHRMQKTKTEGRARSSKISKPAAVTNHLTCIIIFLWLLRVFPFYVSFFFCIFLFGLYSFRLVLIWFC